MTDTLRMACDVLVVGAGPGGIAASACAAESGAKVILVDDNPQPGGQIWRESVDGAALSSHHSESEIWFERLRRCGTRLLMSTRVVARLARGIALAESNHQVIEIAFKRAILATGARELLLPFPGWTVPNVFAPGGLQALVKSGFPVRAKRVVVAGTGPLLLAVAAFLKTKGADVIEVCDQAPWSRVALFGLSILKHKKMSGAALRYRFTLLDSRLRWGWWPVSANGADCVRSVSLTDGSRVRTVECDVLACGFHLIPNTELQAEFGCEIHDGKVVADRLQETSEPGIFSVGESTGVGGQDLALLEGQIAGLAASGRIDEASALFNKRGSLQRMAEAMDKAFAPRPELRSLAKEDTIVCRCEDVPWSLVRSQKSLRAARLYTRCGMGACQGRICGSALRFLAGWTNGATRPPVYPVRLSTLIRESHSQNKERL